jgi:protein SCO1/2
MSKNYAAIAVLVVVVFLALSTFFAIRNGSWSSLGCGEGQVSGAAIGGPFNLVDHKGQPVTDQDIITKPVLIYFGYTFCPDICPYDVARNVEAINILDSQGYGVTPVFITIDPRRDTPQVLSDFVDNMHPQLIGLTGTDAQIKVASKAYKRYYKANETNDEYYLVDHSTFTYLMLPKTGFVDFFRRDETAEQIAKKTACFVDRAMHVS